MSNENRLRHAPGLAYVAVDSATVIEIGDIVYLDTNDVKPASTAALWDTDLATTQAALKDICLGIAMSASASGETDPVLVSHGAVYEMDAASAAYEIGDLVGADKAAGNALLAQTVEAAVAASAIGVVYKSSAGVNVTRVLVYIPSQILDGVKVGE